MRLNSSQARCKVGPVPLSLYVQNITETFERKPVLRTLGVSLSRIAVGEVDLTLPMSEPVRQQHGYLQSGVMAMLAEAACSFACLSRMPRGLALLCVEFKIHFMSAAAGVRFIARGTSSRSDSAGAGGMARVFAVDDDGQETEVAMLHATYMRVEPAPAPVQPGA